MRRNNLYVCVLAVVVLGVAVLEAQTPKPKRINRAIELLDQGQPVYYGGSTGGYEDGKKLAQTKADYINYGLEHGAFDMTKLREFMRGLVDGGPTRTGHRTPAVIATLPVHGLDAAQMRANYWVVQQVLAAGVHGILLCHANEPEAIRVMMEASRYPFAPKADGLKEGYRGAGGSAGFAAQIWGVSTAEYLRKADLWPLNPEGEFLMGLKLENKYALENAERNVRIPGVAFAEWGPGDMGFSLLGLKAVGFSDEGGGGRRRGEGQQTQQRPRVQREYPPVMLEARARVLQATKQAKIFFLNSCNENNVIDMIKEGVMICTGGEGPGAEIGRQFTKRQPPW